MIKQSISSELRAAWQAEVKACDKRRTSLIRQMKRARTSGNRRKFEDLENQYWQRFRPCSGPRTDPATPLVTGATLCRSGH